MLQILSVWGYTDVVLWTDQEEAITAVVTEVTKRRNKRMLHAESPATRTLRWDERSRATGRWRPTRGR